jgi:hypothetical protein
MDCISAASLVDNAYIRRPLRTVETHNDMATISGQCVYSPSLADNTARNTFQRLDFL